MSVQLTRKIQPRASIVYNGQNALRLLMAEDTPGIDLLVREAVQNSLDAAVKTSRSVTVEFKYDIFNPLRLRGILDDETVDSLLRIHTETSTSLYVRDLGTLGLSGPRMMRELSQDDREGNYLKLCHSMGIPQDSEGAGGSWGFGKTVFFRVCHAPVLFYSRFKEGDSYIERLIFYLIEDVSLPDAITKVQGTTSTGFAWWGASINHDEILPCEDGTEIQSILDQLGGIPRFSGEETGTLIFMPCLRKGGQMPSYNDATEIPPYWISRNLSPTINEYETYTNVAIQRWYAPRLKNETYAAGRDPFLIARIGNDEVGSTSYPILPVTKIMRRLYDVATGMVVDQRVMCEEIELRRTFTNGSSSGKIAAVRVSPEDAILGMIPPNNYPSPIIQAGGIDVNEEGGTPPIVAMTRKPGMIVAYQNQGDWVQSIKHDPEGHHLISLFVLRSEAQMTDKYRNRTVEEEIRQNEPAAHDRWLSGLGVSGERLRLVENIRTGVQKAINKRFYPDRVINLPTQREASLSAVIAERLLPPDFGDAPSPEPVAQIWTCHNHPEIRLQSHGVCPNCNESLILQDPVIVQRGNEPQISILKQNFLHDGLIEIDLHINNGQSENIELSLNAATEGSYLSVREWENEIETEFPFEIVSGEIYQFKRGAGIGRQLSWNSRELPFTPPFGNNKDSEVKVQTPQNSEGHCYRLVFQVVPNKSQVKCRLVMRVLYPEVMPLIIAKKAAL